MGSTYKGSFRKSALLHFQYGRQAAILSFDCSGDNFIMLGPVEFNVCMLIDNHHTKGSFFANQLCRIFNMAAILNFACSGDMALLSSKFVC
jgi:hypothetical protein